MYYNNALRKNIKTTQISSKIKFNKLFHINSFNIYFIYDLD